MKELTKDDFNVLCKEFEKGNYHHITKSNISERKTFGFVKELLKSRRKIIYGNYDIVKGGLNCADRGTSARYEEWDWKDWKFYTLTKKEADKYVKRLIIKNLEEKE